MPGPRNCAVGLDGRRAPLLASMGAPAMPLTTAAIAAILFADVELMLFLRVTRCAELMVPAERDCECGRDLGSEPAMMVPECRCWLAGRTVMGSWITEEPSAMVKGGNCWTGDGCACLENSHPTIKKNFGHWCWLCSSRVRQQNGGIITQPRAFQRGVGHNEMRRIGFREAMQGKAENKRIEILFKDVCGQRFDQKEQRRCLD